MRAVGPPASTSRTLTEAHGHCLQTAGIERGTRVAVRTNVGDVRPVLTHGRAYGSATCGLFQNVTMGDMKAVHHVSTEVVVKEG